MTGATSSSRTGGKGNPAAPPELVTAIQQSISWRRKSGVISRASVIWTRSGLLAYVMKSSMSARSDIGMGQLFEFRRLMSAA